MKLSDYKFYINPDFLLPESLWLAVEPLLPEELPKPKGGRPRMPNRQAFFAMFYLLRTGRLWNALPRQIGASSTVHDCFQEWRRTGVFEKLWTSDLLQYHTEIGLDFEWQSLGGCITKAPLGGEATGRIPPIALKAAPNGIFLPKRLECPSGLLLSGRIATTRRRLRRSSRAYRSYRLLRAPSSRSISARTKATTIEACDL